MHRVDPSRKRRRHGGRDLMCVLDFAGVDRFGIEGRVWYLGGAPVVVIELVNARSSEGSTHHEFEIPVRPGLDYQRQPRVNRTAKRRVMV